MAVAPSSEIVTRCDLHTPRDTTSWNRCSYLIHIDRSCQKNLKNNTFRHIPTGSVPTMRTTKEISLEELLFFPVPITGLCGQIHNLPLCTGTIVWFSRVTDRRERSSEQSLTPLEQFSNSALCLLCRRLSCKTGRKHLTHFLLLVKNLSALSHLPTELHFPSSVQENPRLSVAE